MNAAIYLVGIVLQTVASLLALIQVGRAPRRLPWFLIALSSLIIVARRLLGLPDVLSSGKAFVIEDSLTLLVSITFFAGVLMSVGMFEEMKARNDELRRSSLYSRSLLEVSLDPLVTISAEGTITDVNTATELATGLDRSRLVGSDFADYCTEPEKAREGYRRVFVDGQVRDYPLALRHATGGLTDVLYNASLYRDERGRVMGVFAAARDVTQLKRAEASLRSVLRDLERSNTDLENFAFVASHDLQEPLRMVASYTQLLADRYRDRLDDKAVKYIDYAVDGARRMQQLIDDLLTYSRVGTRGKTPSLTPAQGALDLALENLEGSIAQSGAVVTQDEMPTVIADSAQLAQVFQNLIGNAIKFRGDEAPRIHVSAATGTKGWTFRVRDNGIGIDPRYAERVFVIFQRLHTRQEYPGTGIGLAVCKRIIERQGGRIWVESEPGKGSTFCFTISRWPKGDNR